MMNKFPIKQVTGISGILGGIKDREYAVAAA